MADPRSPRFDAALALTATGATLVVAGTVGVLGRLAFHRLVAHSALAVCLGIGAIAGGFLLQGRRRREQVRPIHRTRPVAATPFTPPVPVPVRVPLAPARVRVEAWIGPPRALPRA